MGTSARIFRLALACFVFLTCAVVGVAVGTERTPHAHIAAESLGRASVNVVLPTAAPDTVKVPVRTAHLASRPPVAKSLRSIPFASVGGVQLVHPADVVDRIGFHQASDVHDLQFAPLPTATRPTVMPSRSRATRPRTAADVEVDPQAVIYAPVSGIVKRAKGYHLYCKYADSFVAISPAGHPELEVKMLHITGLRVRPGDRVVAGKTIVAQHATKFPFVSQVEVYSAHRWPHVHMEVTRLAVPSAIPQPGKGLLFGCA